MFNNQTMFWYAISIVLVSATASSMPVSQFIITGIFLISFFYCLQRLLKLNILFVGKLVIFACKFFGQFYIR